ncbi:MAG: hypothetical protein PHN31_01030 [Candidatus Gracilibacteria bacterium]|nr:hypothetical protein [Candidatus Gracilibacteria bacterium]
MGCDNGNETLIEETEGTDGVSQEVCETQEKIKSAFEKSLTPGSGYNGYGYN